MSHVAPHHLADLAAGRLSARRSARVHTHLDACPRCLAAWERIRSARAAFVDMAGGSAPELRWDRIRAQVYWSLGQARDPVIERGRPRLGLMLVGLGAAAAVAAWAPWRSASAPVAASWAASWPQPATVRPPAPAPSAASTPTALAAVVTFLEGDVHRGRAGAAPLSTPAEVGAALVVAGDHLATDDGRVALQLGAASTATLGRRSQLTVTRLDDAMIALAVEGRIDIEVSHRAADQRFLVVAGEHTVEVRGTAFRVDHVGGALTVACEHGRVAVSAGATTVEVAAGQGLVLGDHEALLANRVRALADAELAALTAARVPALPLWTDAATVLATTAPLALEAPRGRAVRVDGEVVGAGPVWMRVPAGRHLVEAERADGELGPGRWIVVDGRPTPPVSLGDVPPPQTSPAAARRARESELGRRIDRGRLQGCVRALAKQGMAAGTHVDLEIGVDARGAIEFLNLAGTDLPDRVAGCVRDVIADARLGAGPRATWRHRVGF